MQRFSVANVFDRSKCRVCWIHLENDYHVNAISNTEVDCLLTFVT